MREDHYKDDGQVSSYIIPKSFDECLGGIQEHCKGLIDSHAIPDGLGR